MSAAAQRDEASWREALAWNAQHPVGTRVVLHRVNGHREVTRTSTEAHVLKGNAMVGLAGWPGLFPLHRVEASR